LQAAAPQNWGRAACEATDSKREEDVMSIAVMLATLTDRRDFGDGWLLERKFDGERCVVRREAMWSGSSRAPVRI
jgi:ATP-dependent DNA ligase